jgi:TPR repeat protein
MPIFSAAALRLLAIAALCVINVVAHRDQPPSEQAQPFEAGVAAFRAGEQALAADHGKAAITAFEAAAAQGVLGAQLRLARLYRGAGGFERDDAKSLRYYQMLADQNADIDPLHPASIYVAEAFREMAAIYLAGSESAKLTPKPQRAARLLLYAASYLRDPRAQFDLAKLYVDGVGVARSERLAMRWLMNAARKKYAPAQAYLGELLWKVQDSPAHRARGLALLAIAADNADAQDSKWIAPIYTVAAHQAQPAEIAMATRLLSGWGGLRMRADDIAIAGGDVDTVPAGSEAKHLQEAEHLQIVDADRAGPRTYGIEQTHGAIVQAAPMIGNSDRLASHAEVAGARPFDVPLSSNGLPVLSIALGSPLPLREKANSVMAEKPYAEVDISLYYGDTQQHLSLGNLDRTIALGLEQIEATD